MTDECIVKICKIHGALTEAQAKLATKKREGTVVSKWYKCRYCMRELDKRYWHRNKQAKLDYKKDYIKANKDIILEQQRAYEEKQRSALTDRYVISKLIGSTQLKTADIKIVPDLINLKRATILLKRKIKEENEHKKHIRLEAARGSDFSEAGKEFY